MNNKKILFVLPRMGGGGAERVVSLIANSLSKNNSIHIFTLVGGESFYQLNEEVIYDSVNITVNRKNKLTTLWSEATSLYKSFVQIRNYIKKEKFDIVISFLVETDILVGLCKLFGLKFKHVCSERNDPTKRSGLQLKIITAIYKRATLFVCQSKMVASFYKEVPTEIKRVISNPVQPENLPQRNVVNPNRIVAVGRLSTQKNFRMLINSFSNTANEFSEATLDIYGEGPQRETLQAQIDLLNLTGRITLCGARKDLQQCIADAQLFVMSSDYEGFPNALLEAIAIGIPVISTDFPTGIAKELIGKENGLVVPVDDEKSMTDGIRYMLSHKELLSDMGNANYQMAKRFYTENIIKMWEEELTSIL
ncbi:MAG: glycosyltransferase [Eubacteriales bacterium]|nr:glycosyltransferase [Eubacteriales bacterium]